MNVHFTVDVEQDCPPFLDSWRGIEEGMPKLLRLLADEGVPATCFATGDIAVRYPDLLRTIVSLGHELGCHGHSHRSFADLTRDEADAEIAAASASLRRFGPVVSFRAPYLRFPRAFVELLAEYGYQVDSSQGRHKRLGARVHRDHGILRVPASVTSSTLRWPAFARNVLFARLHEPVVLFVHPWEFVDLRRAPLRFDCRFRTGDEALDDVRATLGFFRARGATFGPIRDCADR